eukprot:6463803-Ditylum_brightwellii.AAC.1
MSALYLFASTCPVGNAFSAFTRYFLHRSKSVKELEQSSEDKLGKTVGGDLLSDEDNDLGVKKGMCDFVKTGVIDDDALLTFKAGTAL